MKKGRVFFRFLRKSAIFVARKVTQKLYSLVCRSSFLLGCLSFLVHKSLFLNRLFRKLLLDDNALIFKKNGSAFLLKLHLSSYEKQVLGDLERCISLKTGKSKKRKL